MALDVEVNLTLVQPSGTASFGIPLFVAANVAPEDGTIEVDNTHKTTGVPYTECTSLEDVVSAGFLKTSKLYNAVSLMLSQSSRPKKFAVYGTTNAAVLAEFDTWKKNNWRQLITVSLGTSTPAAVAAKIETLDNKMYFTSISIENADTKTDAEFKTAWETAMSSMKPYERTVVMYYDNTVQTPEAALVGETAARDVGSFTYKNIILKNVPALKLNDSRINTISGTDDTGHALTVVTKAGDIVTTDGKTASGEYIDIVDSKDWIIENIAYDSQSLLNREPKVPYTSVGITQLENVVLSVLKTAFDNGMIASREDNEKIGDYSTSFTPVSEIPESSRAERHYSGGRFGFRLAGAIHTAEINGTITV